MVAMVRQPKLLGSALFLSVATFFLVMWHSGWASDAYSQYRAYAPGQGGLLKTAADETKQPPPHLDGAGDQGGYIPTLVADAHKFKNANAFAGHFFNLSITNAMTMQQAKSTCQWEDPNQVNFQFGEASSWGVDLSWVTEDHPESTLLEYRDAWRWFIRDKLLQFDRYVNRFQGRGIVIVGGQGRSLKRIQVILKQLKKLNCTLPIELHYWGAELEENHGKELLKLWPNMYFNNLASPDNIVDTIHSGLVHYALKTAAMINSRFADILLLDSDNIPVQDPETLFDSDTYKEYGTIFWPDIARTRPNNPIWPITNTFCRMDEWEQESGQMLVNKMKYFYHLQLSHWFISDLEYGTYFRSTMLGDKDTFRFAWHALRTKFGIPPKWVTSVGTLHERKNDEPFFCGHTFAQYHPNGQIAFLHGGLLKTMRKEVVLWELEKNGGVFQAYKQSPHAEDNSYNPTIRMQFDGQEYLPEKYKPEGGLEVSWCTDFAGIEARSLEEVLPGFNKVYEEIGGYWIAKDTGDGSIWDGSL